MSVRVVRVDLLIGRAAGETMPFCAALRANDGEECGAREALRLEVLRDGRSGAFDAARRFCGEEGRAASARFPLDMAEVRRGCCLFESRCFARESTLRGELLGAGERGGFEDGEVGLGGFGVDQRFAERSNRAMLVRSATVLRIFSR